ncbi:MAG TPA: BON domain-containing protein [Gammaproteobacteria bacterium]|nr:BON domain-containing protein [Gammaproteobacteria bacterium]
MESYDERRRRDEERRQAQARDEDSGRHRDTWWHRERENQGDHPRRAERGWLDYDRDYGRDYGGADERQGRGEQQRYGQSGERQRFSPDWSREGAEPRYSDDPYYSRNRERSRRGDYDDPDWPYDRGNRNRDAERAQQSGGREDEGSHYRGWYSRSGRPFSYAGGQGYVFSESLTLHGPYTGRGPKGYKRSDQQIMEEACQRLERDGEIDASDIEVTSEDGVIRLRGTVHDRKTKRRAEECVESIYGARDVMNELRVSQEGREQWQGSQASQGGQTLGQRPGAGSSTADQMSDDKRAPKH